MVAPWDTPVTSPVAGSMVATDGSWMDHVTVRPVSSAPVESNTAAVKVVTPPTRTSATPGVTRTESTGTCETTRMAASVIPSLSAVTVVVPAATPVTAPVAASMVATAGSPMDQATARPTSSTPVESNTVATYVVAPPTRMEALSGTTRTESTARSETVTEAVSSKPSMTAAWRPRK